MRMMTVRTIILATTPLTEDIQGWWYMMCLSPLSCACTCSLAVYTCTTSHQTCTTCPSYNLYKLRLQLHHYRGGWTYWIIMEVTEKFSIVMVCWSFCTWSSWWWSTASGWWCRSTRRERTRLSPSSLAEKTWMSTLSHKHTVWTLLPELKNAWLTRRSDDLFVGVHHLQTGHEHAQLLGKN